MSDIDNVTFVPATQADFDLNAERQGAMLGQAMGDCEWNDEHGTPIWAKRIDGEVVWNPHSKLWLEQWSTQMRKVAAAWQRQIAEGFRRG